MNTEQEFLKLLQETLKQARRNGGKISRGEIGEIFGSFSLDEEQITQVEAYLKAHRISVGAAGQDPDALQQEEREFLISYQAMLEDIPRLSDSVMDAVRLSAMAGESSAQKELAEQMMGSVVDIARLYVGQGVGIEDLIGAGNEALALGVTMLDHLESPQEVEGELGRRIMDSMEDMISMMLDDHARDREIEDLTNLVAGKAKELAQTLGRKVTAHELAREGEVTMEQIMEAKRLTGDRIEDLQG